MISTRLDGKRVLLTQSNDFMRPALTEVFRDSGAEVIADPQALPLTVAAETARVKDIKAALLIHHAETDPNINAMWPAYEGALKAASVRYEAFIYPGTQHGFHNNSTPRYVEAAANLSWERTLAFFRKHLA